MHPIHDVDVILLLATTLASKRRPAALAEILAAFDILPAPLPAEQKLAEGLERLSQNGLLSGDGDAFTLTPAAQAIMGGQRRKTEKGPLDERLFGVRESLAAYVVVAAPPIVVTAEQVQAALAAHRAAAAVPVKNLLMPKPTPAEGKRNGPGVRQRKPLPSKHTKGRQVKAGKPGKPRP